ncbi:MAG: hypothetical protein NTV03_03205, partial [Candidatus Nomurabacteria bacterium]|nr:hypothetical protein [Candidatus Nomurabacteria bacterium]
MKKLIALLFVFGFIVFSAPQVHASVLSDALLKIQNLQKEVEKLKTQIGAAVYSSRYNSYLGGTSSGTTPGSTSGTNTDCQSGEIFSYSTGQRCPIAPVVIPTPIISSITVLTPNGGEVYYLGDGNSFTKQIKLVSSKIGTHSIYLVENPSINNLGSKFFLSSTVGSVNPINGIDTSTTSLATGLINPGQYYVMSEWKSSDG